MSDDTPTPKDPQAPDNGGGDGQQAEHRSEQKTAKPGLSDEEKAAKVAAAKAKAAARTAAVESAQGDGDPAPPKPPWEDKPVAPGHEDAAGDPDVVALAGGVEGAVLAADRFAGDVTVTVPRELVRDACRYLKQERGYRFLVDLTAVDWTDREEGRFDVVYWMHRFDDSTRLRLRCAVPEADPTVDSVQPVWRTADWMEREVYDMFGITFEGHPNLERILTWEGFNGHPLRKDFPVEGIDTGAAIYPEVYPEGGGPVAEEKGDEA